MSNKFTIKNEKGQTKLTDFYSKQPVKFQPKVNQHLAEISINEWMPYDEYIAHLKKQSQIKRSQQSKIKKPIMKSPRNNRKKYSSEKNKNYIVEDVFHPYCQMIVNNSSIVVQSAPPEVPEFEELDINWDNYCPTCYEPKIRGYVYCVACQSLY